VVQGHAEVRFGFRNLVVDIAETREPVGGPKGNVIAGVDVGKFDAIGVSLVDSRAADIARVILNIDTEGLAFSDTPLGG
jgi:hypothetical protein